MNISETETKINTMWLQTAARDAISGSAEPCDLVELLILKLQIISQVLSIHFHNKGQLPRKYPEKFYYTVEQRQKKFWFLLYCYIWIDIIETVYYVHVLLVTVF